MIENLALFGGTPVRDRPYPIHTTILDDAEEKQVIAVLREGHLSGFSGRAGERFLGGHKVREFEANVAQKFGVRHAVSFNSATSALHGSIMACGIGPGDEVITSPFTMSATASAIFMQHAVPIFADIEDSTYGLNPDDVIQKITPRTKAILTVNLFGQPSRLSELTEIADTRGLALIEDNCQSPGAQHQGRFSGTWGKIGILSLNYHKAIQTGEGGVALTNDDDAALRMQLLRNHGEVVVADIGREDEPAQLGYNYRLTEIQAAIGIPQLEKLVHFNAIRVELATALSRVLAEYDFLIPPMVAANNSHVYYLYPMRFLAEKAGFSRSTFVRALKAEGIAIAEAYVKPLYLHPLYQKKHVFGKGGCPFTCGGYSGNPDYSRGSCPVTERLHFEEILTTDICKYPNSLNEVDEFDRAMKKIAVAKGRLQAL